MGGKGREISSNAIVNFIPDERRADRGGESPRGFSSASLMA